VCFHEYVILLVHKASDKNFFLRYIFRK